MEPGMPGLPAMEPDRACPASSSGSRPGPQGDHPPSSPSVPARTPTTSPSTARGSLRCGTTASCARRRPPWRECADLAPPVPEVDDLGEDLRLDKFEVGSLWQRWEVRGAAPQDNGIYEQPVLIDEVFLGEGGGESGTADGHDAGAGLVLKLGDLVSDVTAGQAGVTFYRRQTG